MINELLYSELLEDTSGSRAGVIEKPRWIDLSSFPRLRFIWFGVRTMRDGCSLGGSDAWET